MEPLSLVIPTFNEAEAIASVIHEIPVAHRLDFIIAEAVALTGHRGRPRGGCVSYSCGHSYGRACALGAVTSRQQFDRLHGRRRIRTACRCWPQTFGQHLESYFSQPPPLQR